MHTLSLMVFAAAFALGSGAARADATRAVGHTTASLLSATTGWTPGHTLRLGLRFVLAPGWHTYWSNPGDAGLAPIVTVALDEGRPEPAKLRFPAPALLPTGPLMGYGYEGDVLLPFDVAPPAGAGATLTAAVHADWLVCATVCVPEQADLTLSLPRQGSPSPSSAASLFARAERDMPRPSPFRASLSTDGRLRVAGAGVGPQSVSQAVFIPDTPGLIDQAARQNLSVSDGALTLTLHPAPGLKPDGLLSGVLSLTDGGGQRTALLVSARRGTAPAAPAPISASAPASLPASLPAGGLLASIAASLLGGVLLNLMPCVFPVLAMKALALGRHGQARRQLRRSALLYAAGIMAAFAVIGLAVLALRAAGHQVGWGFQFQSPIFVAAVACLLFAVGLNLAGLFEIGTGLIGTGLIGTGLIGTGQGWARAGAAGDVLTGVLAVLVATPCTAPFMGAAVAAALTGPPADTFAIFLSLGLGLALPSLVLGFVPGLAGLLPRPGAWMLVTRQFLAFPMFAATVWLLWVLSEEAGPPGILAGLCGLLLIAFGGWLHGVVQRTPSLRDRTRRSLGIASLASVLAALSMLPGLRTAAGTTTSALDGSEPFTPSRLAQLRQDRRPVFVDMSAAWCVTCLVNERLALAPSSVRDAFAADRVALLRGDWTSRNPIVTDFLHRFGRDGVPLYVFFPADGAPHVLPQVLTPGLVLATVNGT